MRQRSFEQPGDRKGCTELYTTGCIQGTVPQRRSVKEPLDLEASRNALSLASPLDACLVLKNSARFGPEAQIQTQLHIRHTVWRYLMSIEVTLSAGSVRVNDEPLTDIWPAATGWTGFCPWAEDAVI